jgi:protoporphyrinogen oxidase
MEEHPHGVLEYADNIEYFDAVVLGAGISGLVSAAILAKQGCGRILLVDEYKNVGGNHLDWSSNGYTFDIGSLIFQDDSPLLAYFPELLPLYVPIKPEWARLNPQGKITTYPISVRDDIIGAGPVVIARIFASLIASRLFNRRMRNAQDFVRFWIGGYLSRRSGLESYMRRFYGVSADEIDIELAKKRMMWVSEHASIRTWVAKLTARKKSGPSNQQLARPRDGFASLYAVAVNRLSNEGVQVCLGAQISRIAKNGHEFQLDVNGRMIAAGRIISTIPIERSVELCGLEAGPHLSTIRLTSLFFSFSGIRGFRQSVIYNFSHKADWKRLTMYSDFYGKVDDREYFGVEVIGSGPDGTAVDAEAAFRQHVQSNGMFEGDLRLEGSRTLDHAYPIYRRNAAKHAAEAIEKLRSFGVESFGRQGGFNYQPTARSSTVEAEIALQQPTSA